MATSVNIDTRVLSRKRVRFSDEATTIILIRRYSHTSIDKNRSWISKPCMMLNAKTIDDESFHNNDHDRIKRDLSRLFDCPVKDRIEILVRLNRDLFHLRGLERRVCQEHGSRMNWIQKGSIHAVLTLQHHQRTRQEGTQEEKALQLATLSQERTQSARVLARVLAMSDQRILREQVDHQERHAPPRKLKSESSKSPRFQLTQKMKMLRHSYTAPRRLPSLRGIQTGPSKNDNNNNNNSHQAS